MASLSDKANEIKLNPEINRNAAWERLLSDEKLADVTLQSNDGVTIPANRCILAARSPVFERMLFGNFAEASSPVVTVGYSGDILKAVVEYIYTDTASILDDSSPSEDSSVDSAADTTKTLVSLSTVALFFDLSGLYQKAQDRGKAIVKEKPGLSLFLLEAIHSVGAELETGALYSLVLANIRKKTADHLTGNALLSLSPATLEAIISDDKLETNELALFHAVKYWVDSNGTDNTDDKAEVGQMEQAEQFMKHIHFEKVDPKELTTTVASSGLVPNKVLFEAYKAQALAAVQKYDMDYLEPRFQSLVPLSFKWKGSGDEVFQGMSSGRLKSDIFDCPEMTQGVFEWTIEVIKLGLGSYVQLGIIPSTAFGLSRKSLKVVEGSFGYNDAGYAIHSSGDRRRRSEDGDSVTIPMFFEGDKITLRLELSSGDDLNGILSASKNGGDVFRLFSNIKGKRKAGERVGFLPAASIKSHHEEGKLRILEFQRVYK